MPGDGVGGGAEWSLPADQLQPQQHVFFSRLHHHASHPRSGQRCFPFGQRVARHTAEPQRLHFPAGTGKAVGGGGVCINEEDICNIMYVLWCFHAY